MVAGLGYAQSRPVKAPPKAGGGDEGLNLPSPGYGFVPNPKDYYIEVRDGSNTVGGAQINPLYAPWCRYVFTYGKLNSNSTTQVITATSEDAPDWAFVVTIPWAQIADCYGAVLYITWDGQADSPAQSQQNKGIAFRCEVEQWDGPTKYIVPCPGTHFFTPWVIRADTAANGQQNHTSYNGALVLPWYVNGGAQFKPYKPGDKLAPQQAWGDVTFRFGFVVRTDGTAQHRVWNQNLMLELGPPVIFGY